jgi:hypothetical protein
MANVINKKTGQYLKSVHTPDYSKDADWIINPSQAEIDQYKAVPAPVDPDVAQKEQLISQKKRELAIEALKAENKLDANGDLVK